MFWSPVSNYCFKLPFCLFGDTIDTSVTYEKAKYVCFIDMLQQKVKFREIFCAIYLFLSNVLL